MICYLGERNWSKLVPYLALLGKCGVVGWRDWRVRITAATPEVVYRRSRHGSSGLALPPSPRLDSQLKPAGDVI
jgi:hypothetical protein